MLSIQLSSDIENRLHAIAKDNGRSLNDFVQEAILAHLDKQTTSNDYSEETIEAMQDCLEGNVTHYATFEDMQKDLA